MSKGWRLSLCSLAAALAVMTTVPAWGQLRINSSPSQVGSGARALGMGGAFIAVADDATAASWNPGGLTQLERPELSLVYGWNFLSEKFDSSSLISPVDVGALDFDEINYLSLAWPLPWTLAGRNFVVSLNYQRKYDFNRRLELQARTGMFTGRPLYRMASLATTDVVFKQDGHLAALSPAFGFELTDRLSAGVAVNIWDSRIVPGNEWESVTERRSVDRLFLHRRGADNDLARVFAGRANTYEKYDDVEGINYTFGLLYKATQNLSLGAVYHTAYATEVDYRRISRLRNPFGADHYNSQMRIEWPGAVGIGTAYRFPSERLTLSFDVTRRNWERFIQIDERAGLGARISPLTGLYDGYTKVDPVYTIRLGAEYVFFNPDKARQNLMPSLRAGLFYDPQPASGRRDRWWGVDQGDGDPDPCYGATFGAGVLIKNRVNIDAAYIYRWGDGIRKDTLAGAGRLERDFESDIDQHQVFISTVVYF